MGDLMCAVEDEVSHHLENGYCTPAEWRDYWWAQRAYALQYIDGLRKQVKYLEGYVNRCSERLQADGEADGR